MLSENGQFGVVILGRLKQFGFNPCHCGLLLLYWNLLLKSPWVWNKHHTSLLFVSLGNLFGLELAM